MGEIAKAGLRPPQVGSLHALAAHWTVDQSSALIVLPTGTGKTEVMIASLLMRRSKRLLVRPRSIATPFTFPRHPRPIEQFTGDVNVVITRPDLRNSLGNRGQSFRRIKPDPLPANDFEPLAHIGIQVRRDSVSVYGPSVPCLIADKFGNTKQ
jgi:hypothetical protein